MKILQYTIAGTPLCEAPRVLAETVAPQTMLRRRTGYTMAEYLPMALEQGTAEGPYAWTMLAELMDCRPTAAQLHTAITETGVGMTAIRAGLEPGLADVEELNPRYTRRVRRLLDQTDQTLAASHPDLASQEPA